MGKKRVLKFKVQMTVQSLRFPKAQSLIIRREVIENHSLMEIIVRILLKQLDVPLSVSMR